MPTNKTCNVCSKNISADHYARHLAGHKKRFQCNICEFRCSRKDNYHRHLKLHQAQACSKTRIVEEPITSVTVESNVADNNERLMRFQVEPLTDSNKIKSLDFKKPFTCKVLSPRGGGKTTFVVNYIQQVASMNFTRIYIVTSTPDQETYNVLRGISSITFTLVDSVEKDIKEQQIF
jgi:hypothetical protein